MAKRYEVFRKGNEPSKDIAKYGVAVAELVERLPKGTAYQFKKRGQEEWRSRPSKPKLKEALLDMSLRVGEAIYARRKGGRATFVLRAIESLPVGSPCPDPNATAGVKACWDAVQRETAKLEQQDGVKYDVVFMGIYACRRIDGSSLWSQHAWRNGLDFRIRRTGADAASIDSRATGIVAYRTREVAAETLWDVPGHTYHCHQTGDPKRFGTPPCA